MFTIIGLKIEYYMNNIIDFENDLFFIFSIYLVIIYRVEKLNRMSASDKRNSRNHLIWVDLEMTDLNVDGTVLK